MEKIDIYRLPLMHSTRIFLDTEGYGPWEEPSTLSDFYNFFLYK